MGATAAPGHGARLSIRSSVLGAGFAGLLCLVGVGSIAAASGYLDSVRQAERYLVGRPSTSEVEHALTVLQAGTECRQPEIASDLTEQPPDLEDARIRLSALDQALSDTLPPTQGTQGELRRLGAAAPYDREQPESPGDLLTGWFQAREAALFGGCGGGWAAVVLRLLEVAGIAALAIAAAVLAWRFVRSRSRAQEEPQEDLDLWRRRSAQERFAAADRLAAAGDYAAALRELTGAVTTVLGGDAAWDASPLTVRELFQRAGLLTSLRPLLRGFEEAVYGHRPVTRETYEAAAAAAAPHRAGVRQAA